MTKGERKARRLEKRAKRRASRVIRKEKRKVFKSAMNRANITVDIDDQPAFVEVFNQYWPIAKPAFEYAVTLRVTKDNVDDVLETIIDIGDRIYSGNASPDEEKEFIELLERIWAGLKIGLELLQVATGKKADDTIDDIIEIGEYILGKDGDE